MSRVTSCATLLAILSLAVLASGCSESGASSSADVPAGDPATSTHTTGAVSSTPAKPPVTATFASVPAAIEQMQISAEARDDDQSRAIGEWLVAQGSGSIAPLVAVVNDSSQTDKVRREACRVLGEIGPAARDELHAAVGSDNVWVQSMAIKSLGTLRPVEEESVRVVMTQLDHQEDLVVQTAIVALGTMGEPASLAVEQLQDMQNDTTLNDTVRNRAHAALKKIDPRRGFSGLGES